MVANTFKHIEIRLWDLVIQTLTESAAVRQLVRNGYFLFHNQQYRKDWLMAATVGTAGLVCGVATYFMVLFI